jgi:U3 small nucleolar RNA-associated protein 3
MGREVSTLKVVSLLRCAPIKMLQTPRMNFTSIGTKSSWTKGLMQKDSGNGQNRVSISFRNNVMLANIFQDAFLEQSDEEILGYSPSEDEEDESEVEQPQLKSKSKSNVKSTSEDEAIDEDDEDVGGWGSSKRDYYNADNIETEADALEEESEAKRLQQKKLQKMSDADFGFDENEWLDPTLEDNDGDVVTEVLKDVDITADMGTEERLKILRGRYPEFEFLANEFLQLQPLLEEFQLETSTGETTKTVALSVVKRRALAAYIGSLTMYFAILTSTANVETNAPGLDPMELREHDVMESVLLCRELWTKVKDLKAPSSTEVSERILTPESTDEDMEETPVSIQPRTTKKSRKERAREAVAAEALQSRTARIKAAEAGLADLSSLLPNSRKTKKPTLAKLVTQAEDSDSDFGEETHLDARTAAAKELKKKSLRFYTSQIAQKANRRADAGRDAGGDADLPYRERLRDRQIRLNAEAEKRGKKLDEYGRGADLGGDSGDDDEKAVAEEVRDEEDEYYDMVAQKSTSKKADKAAKYDAIAAAKAANSVVRVVEGELDADGKRAIGYVIEKNKGLAPKRKKDVRNPRVKKRKKYEEKMKKLAGSRAVYKGGEERGGYGGEKTGIKTGLIKSIKL